MTTLITIAAVLGAVWGTVTLLAGIWILWRTRSDPEPGGEVVELFPEEEDAA